MDPHHPESDADSNLYLMLSGSGSGPTFHPAADPDPVSDPRFQIKAQTLEKGVK